VDHDCEHYNNQAFNVLGIENGYKCSYFKRRSITAHHRAIVNWAMWVERVVRTLVLFWANMQQCERFDRYFYNLLLRKN
jgi:hypothetical protein